MTHFIYALLDPDSGKIRYVGKSVDPHKRLKGHFLNARCCNPNENQKKCEWLTRLVEQGKEPLVLILEEASEVNWKEREFQWIKKLRRAGQPLFNFLTNREKAA